MRPVSYAASTRPRLEDIPSPGRESKARTRSRRRDVRISRATAFYRKRVPGCFRETDMVMLITLLCCACLAAPHPKIARPRHKPPKQTAVMDELARHKCTTPRQSPELQLGIHCSPSSRAQVR